jgi:dTDP-4-amino-4,6-dideoxygalactose transaminase
MTAHSNSGGLAIDGGKPVRTKPFAPWPQFPREAVSAASKVLESGQVNYWTGQEGRQFEKRFAEQASCDYGVALANGTVALELALHALGIGPGDEVIVPARTFIASASCVVMRGARPVIADVDYESQNVTAQTIQRAITPRTKAIIVVHLAGWPCDMDPICSLATDLGIPVIEDCAQAHGARYKGRPVGSLADIAAFSFCQDKIITTGGEGGMITTNRRDLWERCWSYKDHGKSYDAVYNHPHPPGFRWLHEEFGTNWRLTEYQSALGNYFLSKIPEMVDVRRRYAALLSTEFEEHRALRTTVPSTQYYHSYYKYYVFLRPEALMKGWNRDRILASISAEGIPCFSGSCSEIYLERAFPKELRPEPRLEVARRLGETSIMFMVHPTLSVEDMEDTCRAVKKVLDAATLSLDAESSRGEAHLSAVRT